MRDTYPNFEELAKCHIYGQDFRIVVHDLPDRSVCLVAPHGGSIEHGTSEITRAIAADNYCAYLFEGLMSSGNCLLHVTSHNFDEPLALKILNKCQTALALHGRTDNGDTTRIFLGGLDTEFSEIIAKGFGRHGFPTLSVGHKFLAKNPKNICNRAISGKGVQLEIPSTLRAKLKREKACFDDFVGNIRETIEKMKHLRGV